MSNVKALCMVGLMTMASLLGVVTTWAQEDVTGSDTIPVEADMWDAITGSETIEIVTEAEAEPAAAPEWTGSLDEAAPAVEGAANVQDPSEPAEGLISIDFRDADIRQVLRIIALKSGVDIVAGTDVEGLVTIKLTDVPWDQAMDIILRTYGFTYERRGKVIRVMTIDALDQEALVTEVYTLNYAKADEVPDVIGDMLSDRGRIKYDDRTNTIIVSDVPSNLTSIGTVIKRLDRRTPQVLVATKVIETRLEKDENLGIDWSDSLSLATSPTALPTTFPFSKGTSLGYFSRFIPFDTSPANPLATSLPTDLVNSSANPQNLAGVGLHTPGTIGIGTLTGPAFAWTLNMLKSRTETRILNNPSITVLNNKSASIHIGEEYPIPNFSLDPQTGNTTISGYDTKAIGTVLNVTPHVNQSREIVVELKPEIITVGTDVTFDTGQGQSISLPRFTTQTAETQVRVKSGETIAIGGLVQKSESYVETKVPFLGEIPLIGWLFKNSRWSGAGADPVMRDLLIFVTVTIMDDDYDEEHTLAAMREDAGSLYDRYE